MVQREEKIDIIADGPFMKSNMMFKAVQVEGKKEGRGVRKSTPPITETDMTKLAAYFNNDHVVRPNPRLLQKNVIFNIIYYLCHCGQENLHQMTKDWFEIIGEPNGDKYITQVRDEFDKNHREDDTTLTNQGRVYQVKGNSRKIIFYHNI